jgi:hypothetical protein
MLEALARTTGWLFVADCKRHPCNIAEQIDQARKKNRTNGEGLRPKDDSEGKDGMP